MVIPIYSYLLKTSTIFPSTSPLPQLPPSKPSTVWSQIKQIKDYASIHTEKKKNNS